MSVLRGALFIYFHAEQEVEQRLMIDTCNDNEDSDHSFTQRHFFLARLTAIFQNGPTKCFTALQNTIQF